VGEVIRALGLGLDAGGTGTRWALAAASASADGEVLAEGRCKGLTALQLSSADGRRHIESVLAEIAAQVLMFGRPGHVCAGVTGLDQRDDRLCELIARAFGTESGEVAVHSDIDIAYRDLFNPGEGYVVYAGTGSIAAYIDPAGVFHRAGGRGVLLDDAGGGFWIAREALQYVWRREDEQPGAWQQSALARALFQLIGGEDWAHSRQYFYGRERGEIGQLALAVAETADTDQVSSGILRRAGHELARLAIAMINRYGIRPVALAGRAAVLHPIIEAEMRAALPPETKLSVRVAESHIAAARIAARAAAASSGGTG
jgi:N-acetylglucosamine kinase-like BadF-type ATPase